VRREYSVCLVFASPSFFFVCFLQKFSGEQRIRILFCILSRDGVHFTLGATGPVRRVSYNPTGIFPLIVCKHLINSFYLIGFSGFFHMHDYIM